MLNKPHGAVSLLVGVSFHACVLQLCWGGGGGGKGVGHIMVILARLKQLCVAFFSFLSCAGGPTQTEDGLIKFTSTIVFFV
jgi:hypothetical protein